MRFIHSFFTVYLVALMLRNPERLFAKLHNMPWYRNMLHNWIDSLRIENSAASFLEVGCGPAVFSHQLSLSGKQVTALDNSSRMLNYAKHHFANSQLRLVHGDAYKLPFPDNSFDAVFSASLINVIPNPQQAISEMRRVTRPGGVVSCLVPSTHMTADNINAYIKQHRLKSIEAAALRLWGSRANKLNAKLLGELMLTTHASHQSIRSELQGMALSATITR